MAKVDKKTITVNVPVDLLEQFDMFVKKLGMSRSAYLNFVMASSVQYLDEVRQDAAVYADSKIKEILDNAGK